MSDKILDTGSNYPFEGARAKPKNVGMSGFNMSYVNTFTADEGRRYPSWVEYCVQGDVINYSIQSIIKVVNTPTVPLLSRQRAFWHTYFLDLCQLWKYAEVFFPKKQTLSDYRRLDSMTVPKVTFTRAIFDRHGDILDMLGYKLPNNLQSYSFSAFNFMAYLRINRDYSVNKKLLADYLQKSISVSGDKFDLVYNFLFPDFDGDFIIGSSQWNAFSESPDAIILALDCLSWSYFADDYFTTSLFTPVHGDAPFLSTNLNAHLDYKGINIANPYKDFPLGIKTDGSFDETTAVVNNDGTWERNDPFVSNFFHQNFAVNGTIDLTMDSLRNLACATSVLEKLAKTDGTYAEFGKAFFGARPSNSSNFKASFIGSSYQSIRFGDVINTANAQGTISGVGGSASQGDVGTFTCGNYGIAMTLFTIMPDTYYTQGMHRQLFYETSDDFYLPERAGLGMQEVKNGEIYFQGNDTDKLPFGYQNRLDEMRYRYNECHGLVADPSKLSWSPYIEKRVFSVLPTLSHEFASTKDNINAEWKSADEVGYLVQVLNTNYMKRPLPYFATENNLGF